MADPVNNNPAAAASKTEDNAEKMRQFQEKMMEIQTANSITQIHVSTVMGMNDGAKEVAKKVGDSASRS